MRKYKISINQLADFSIATEAGKRRIISQQLDPDPFRIQWYRTAKASVRKSIMDKGDLAPILDSIQTLRNKTSKSKRDETNRNVSIEALERFVLMKLPKLLKQIDYEIIKSKVKSTSIDGVNVIVAPEVIIRGTIDGKRSLGAVKIHISKNKPFSLNQSEHVASTIFKYLSDEIAEDGDFVIPELCISLDIFSGRVVTASGDHDSRIQEVIEVCKEIKKYWDAA